MVTVRGIEVERINTEEFAKRLINNPNKVYDFSTQVNDNSLQCWYQAYNTIVMDVQCVLVHPPIYGAIEAYKIDMSDTEQFSQVIRGLERFKAKKEVIHDNWYLAA